MPAKKDKADDVVFEEAMNITGFGKFSWFVILVSGLTFSTSLLGSMDVSFLLPAAQCDLELSSKDKGLLTSAYFIGTVSASHLSGYLTDTLGRRYVLVRGLSLNVIFYILGAFAPNFWTFFIIKVISGTLTCPGMIATVPLLGEFVPSNRRAQSLLICTALGSIGILYSALIGWLTLQRTWRLDLWFVTFTPWRLFFLLCGVPSLLCSIMFKIMPESPKFLLARGKREHSLKILQKAYSVNSGKELHSYPVQSVTMDAGEALPPPAKGKGAINVLKHICDQTLPLFRPPFLRDLVLCIVLMVDIGLCVNAIFLWLPEITNRIAYYKEEHDGNFYMCEMVKKNYEYDTNFSTETNTTSYPTECVTTINTAVFLPNILISMAQPIVMLTASVVVPLFDRRFVLVAVLVSVSIITFTVTMVPDTSIIIMLFGSIPILAGVCYNVLSSIIIEIFPTYIRAMAVSLNMIFGRLGAITGSQLFSLMIDSRCTLLFRVISGTLLCCSAVPLLFRLKNPKSQKSSKEVLSTKNKC